MRMEACPKETSEAKKRDKQGVTYDNRCICVSNFLTDELQETLDRFGENGYKLVNTMMINNMYGCEVMYLFFTKELQR